MYVLRLYRVRMCLAGRFMACWIEDDTHGPGLSLLPNQVQQTLMKTGETCPPAISLLLVAALVKCQKRKEKQNSQPEKLDCGVAPSHQNS